MFGSWFEAAAKAQQIADCLDRGSDAYDTALDLVEHLVQLGLKEIECDREKRRVVLGDRDREAAEHE